MTAAVMPDGLSLDTSVGYIASACRSVLLLLGKTSTQFRAKELSGIPGSCQTDEDDVPAGTLLDMLY